ncbi:uncharacterized protein LOC131160348 isoform X2 [Malania oleifera]|uniref:uncharacterized protein LOC131160348 isoform X2 n=1 Tax=Malania oleifera TaxID=397392 RepID=UPI0025AE51D3|nr:uncharacterized protein LOC131160348 isoform X2 [Malania oleifera]
MALASSHYFIPSLWSNPYLTTPLQPHLQNLPFSFHPSPPTISVSILGIRASDPCRFEFARCRAAQQSGPVKKRPAVKRKKKKSGSDGGGESSRSPAFSDVETEDGDDGSSGSVAHSQSYQPLALPKPPVGFVLDEQGRVLMASSKRIATIIDSTNNFPLECIIRRVFRSSQGDECMLLCPVDTPVQILKSTNIDGWSAVSDEEVEAILPTAAYALAKIHMHFVYSGFCYTARGGFCYSEDDIFEFRTDDGEDVDGLPTEGVEITCFHLDHNGRLQIADDDLLEDPATTSVVDEETEFNALVEEEAALLESLLGKR